MAKLMLVEDDNNLREIYEARLQAEGYTIVSARDGEEALVVAKAEKPDLIISDVMMPKISGFEMLDILRNTDDLKGVKIIMLTALGQSDDQQRADRLGADRYLVKSQVTLEDIVKVTHELLEDAGEPPATSPAPEAPAPVAPTEPPAAAPAPPPVAPAEPATPAAEPVTPAPAASASPVVAKPPVVPEPAPPAAPAPPADAQSTAQEVGTVEAQIEDFVAGATDEPTLPSDIPPPADDVAEEPEAETPAEEPEPIAEAPAPAAPEAEESQVIKPEPAAEVTSEPEPEAPQAETTGTGSVPIAHKKVISPLESEPKKDIGTLLALEEAKQAAAAPPPPPTAVIATDEAGPSSVPLTGDKVDPSSIAL